MSNESLFTRFTDRARKVMALSNQEAQRLNHEYIGPAHILLGLVKEGSGVGANVMKNLGVELRPVRLAVERMVQAGPDIVTMGKLPKTHTAQLVINMAIEESRTLENNYIGTEHILLGLIRVEDTVASRALAELGVTADAVRSETLRLLGPNNPPTALDELIQTLASKLLECDSILDQIRKEAAPA